MELLIIDNNSMDSTREKIRTLSSKYKNVYYFLEGNQGLSHARNRGYKEAKGDWIVYLDDDAKIHPEYIGRMFYLIENYNFDCIGGMYYAWFPYGHPKWLPKGFGDKELLRAEVGPIDGATGWLSGGNMAIKKKVIEEVGGFDISLGMAGNKVGYGEETFLQIKLKEKGYSIGFDPFLVVDHAVLAHKLKVSWHLKNSFVRGRDDIITSKDIPITKLTFLFLKSIIGIIFKNGPYNLIQLITRNDYYYQNYLIDTLHPSLWYMGVLVNRLKQNV